MAKKLVLVLLAIVFVNFVLTKKVFAECVVPGPHMATSVTTADLNSIRQSYGSNNCQIATTIILTDGTINDVARTSEILQAAKNNNLKLTIRVYGVPSAQAATTLGTNLSRSLTATGMQSSVVEFGNEVNLANEGFVSAQNYAQAYTNFARGCTSCSVYLPALGGTSVAEKTSFAKAVMSNLPQDVILATKGIIFNSGAADPKSAVTDWVNTLKGWEQAGLKTANLKFFLTEVGPPNSDANITNLDVFVKGIKDEYLRIKSSPNDPNYQHFAKLSGFTFFFWDPATEAKYMIFIDVNGNIIKKNLTGEGNLEPTEGSVKYVEKATLGAKTGGFKDYPEESKQKCEYGTDGASGKVPMYKRADGSVVEAERTDAGLNFGTTVAGMQCGQVKSDPIAITEVMPYDLGEPTCETKHEWMGLLDIKNVVTPFAKTIADHWVGTLDAEHYREGEIDKMDDQQRMKLSGVLGKLLTNEDKDRLRADFIDYVKKQGGKSMYAGFKVYGTFLTQIPPPRQPIPADLELKWRKYWDKIPFFPNEQVSGQVKFNVCGDKQYRVYPAYQELMRLGLAGNQIFKLLQPKDVQEEYFSKNPDLEKPYKYLVNNYQLPITNNQTISQSTNYQLPITTDPFGFAQGEQIPKQETIIDRVKNFLTGIFGKTKQVLAAPAGQCFHLEVSVDSSNNATVCLVSDNGKDGDVQFDINGESLGQFAFNYKFHEGKYCWSTGIGGGPIKIPAGGSINFHAKLDNCNSEDNEQSCSISANANGKVNTTCKIGEPPKPPVPACDPAKGMCCPTKTGCDGTCNICKLARYGPPFTVDGDPNNTKEMNKKSLTIGDVSFSWDKAEDLKNWKEKRVRPAGCKPETSLPIKGLTACSNNGDLDCGLDEMCGQKGGGKYCFPITCLKENTREVSVYNNVPYLYSLWEQAAGKGLGFLTLLKPSEKFVEAVKATPLPEGCTTDEGVVFDKDGNFSPAPAAAKVQYEFDGIPIKGVESVTMTSTPEKNLMFYRLGGVCNANKWFSEKVLAPASE